MSSNSYDNSQSEKNSNNSEFVNNAAKDSYVSTYGIFFCRECKNMLAPDKAKQSTLVFSCKICGPQEIDFKQRYGRDCLIYSKQLQLGSRKSIADNEFVFDPTMPRIKIQCEQCGYDEAVYYLTPDQGQRKIVVKLICANVDEKLKLKCYHIWQMDQSHPLYHQFRNKKTKKIIVS